VTAGSALPRPRRVTNHAVATVPAVEDERFRAVFEEGYGAVRRYLLHRGVSAADADDLSAEVFSTAWDRRNRVPADDPVPWLLAVARNHWRNHLRRTKTRNDLRTKLGEVRSEDPSRDPSSYESSLNEIVAALATLSEKDREVLRLVAWDELSPAQTAVVLGCSPATARVRLHRARARFRDALSRGETNRRVGTVRRDDHSRKEMPDAPPT
jgi:RNA polymerase sigma factor (sigma-70 family)